MTFFLQRENWRFLIVLMYVRCNHEGLLVVATQRAFFFGMPTAVAFQEGIQNILKISERSQRRLILLESWMAGAAAITIISLGRFPTGTPNLQWEKFIFGRVGTF